MRTFLEAVLEDYPEWKSNPTSCIFVLPSRRAGFFLKNLMAQNAGRTLLAPEILSIESFVEQLSGLRYASTTKLLFSLYEAFLDQEGLEGESFYDFSKWGQLLLQDFNELDRYLVDPREFFEYLGSLQEIRHWTPDGSTTPMIEKRVLFWKSLQPIYHQFRDKLQSEGLGYQGQVYRKAAQQVNTALGHDPDKTHIFIGFNALNKAEETIIQHILNEGNGYVYWDADSYYLENQVHDAGLFIRKHKASWDYLQRNPLKGISKYFTSKKEIQITGLPKSVSQAKYCGKLIEEVLQREKGKINNTVLVLGDETLLQPVLHSLPKDLNAVNVTMGFPLMETPAAHLFRDLFEVFSGISKRGLPVKKLLKFFSHPFLQSWFQDLDFNPTCITSKLIRENTTFLKLSSEESIKVPKSVLELLSTPLPPQPTDLLHRFVVLIEQLRPTFRKRDEKVNLEYLYHFHIMFEQLLEMTRRHPFVNDLKALRMLFEQLIKEDSIDFEGEPLEGLQIMGMLESRNLDFETVIITSVNEGILPAGKTNASFIPFEVKKQFGLPTYKEKDAVYTYHFYRLLQRAKSIYICYNTEPDVLEGGEASRFIHQLVNDPILKPNIQNCLAAPQVSAPPEPSTEINKSHSLLELIRKRAEDGFSPTSLSQYIENPFVFYRKYLLGIRDSEELEETLAANTFGSILHDTLEKLYRPLVGEILIPGHISSMRASAPDHLKRSFRLHYLKSGEAQGKNLIALKVMNKYVDLFLDMEERRLQQHQIRILGVEEKLSRPLPLLIGRDIPVLLKGTVDRVEEVDGRLQIIDYKTGRVEQRHLRINQWEQLFTDPEKSKAFQVLCYSWLISERYPTPENGLKAGVFSFKNISAGLEWFGLHETGRKYEESITKPFLGHFQEVLERLLEEIVNPEMPIYQRDKS